MAAPDPSGISCATPPISRWKSSSPRSCSRACGGGRAGGSAAKPKPGRTDGDSACAGYSRIIDEPTSLADLCAVDEITLHFWPGGLAGALMEPKDSLQCLRDSIDCAALVADVPE